MAILAGLIFPFARGVQESSRKSNCEENLRQIFEAVKMYRLDEGGYPLGVADPAPYRGTGLAGLYPAYLKNKGSLHCPDGAVDDPNAVAQPGFPAYDTYDGPDEYAYSLGLDPKNSQATYTQFRNPVASGQPGHESQLGRQLSLLYPDRGTVITWCTQHRPRSGGIPTPQGANMDDIFLFLDGSVQRGTFAATNGGCGADAVYGNVDTTNGYKNPGCP